MTVTALTALFESIVMNYSMSEIVVVSKSVVLQGSENMTGKLYSSLYAALYEVVYLM